MNADAASTRTSEQRLPSPLNGRLYITTRPVSPEKPIPAIGSTLVAELGPAWSDSTVIAATDGPDAAKKILTITHVRIPSEEEQLSSNWEQVQVAIGGKQFPGVVRSVIVAAGTYQDNAPAIDSALPVIPGGLFENDGYVLYDRECVMSGIALEPTFRVDRRTYVKTSDLTGEEYGDLVTKSVTEGLVLDGTAADTGMDVISSVVDPLGNGKSVRQTKRVKGGTWPDPVDEEVSKENGNNPPARYTKDLTRTKTTRKIAASAIPLTPLLSGDQVGKAYKRETPDRAEEITTTQTLTLNTSAVDEAREQKPYVSIVSRMTPGTTSVLPTTGNGSSKLVYEGPTSNIYENTAEVATARPGPAGQEKDVKPYGTFTTAKSYSLGNAVGTPTGSSSVVFNDGAVLIYELGEITFSPNYREIGSEVDKQTGFTRTTNSRYSGSNVVSGLGSASISYTDGVNVVYEVKEIVLSASPVSFDGGKQSSRLYTKSVTTKYSTSSIGTGENYESDVVATDGTTTVYRVNSTAVTSKSPLIYDSVVRDSIPSRLVSIDLIPIARRDKRSQISVFVNIEEGYTGAFPARVTEFYTEDPSAVSGFLPLTMKPTAISYQGILFNLSIGETLHTAFTLTENIGTSDPDYLPQTLTRVVPATTPVEIPSGYQPFAVDLQPFESGFLVKKIEIKYR